MPVAAHRADDALADPQPGAADGVRVQPLGGREFQDVAGALDVDRTDFADQLGRDELDHADSGADPCARRFRSRESRRLVAVIRRFQCRWDGHSGMVPLRVAPGQLRGGRGQTMAVIARKRRRATGFPVGAIFGRSRGEWEVNSGAGQLPRR